MSGVFSFGRGEAVMHSEFMGFVLDDESLVALRGWAERQGYPLATVQQGGPDMFAQMLESSAPPKTAVVDIDGQPDPVAAIARIAGRCGADCKIIAVGTANDVILLHRITRVGATDYIVKPLSTDLLNQAFASALRGPTALAKPGSKEARIVLVIGTRGGAGASTIALNAGWIMAHDLGRSVALLDMDFQFGTSALALDLQPGRGLRDIVSSPNRVDGLMIASSIVPESENFSILGSEETVDEMVPVDGGAISALLAEMQKNFDVIIVDLPRHMLALHKRMAASADDIVLVSDLTLAGIRDTLRIKSALASLGCPGRISVVASRANASESGHVSKAVFEKGIQTPVAVVVPEDTAVVAAASNNGKSLGENAPRSPVTKAIRSIALKISSIEEEAEEGDKAAQAGLLCKLFGSSKSKKSSTRGQV